MSTHRRDKSFKSTITHEIQGEISDKDRVTKSIQNEILTFTTFLESAKNIEDIVPLVQKKKEDAEARQKIFNKLPEDFAIEIAPILVNSQIASEEYVKATLPSLPNFNREQVISTTGSSGAGTAFVSIVANIINSNPYYAVDNPWTNEVNATIATYADKVARRDYLPDRLNQLYPTLGDAFNIAISSIDRCKAKTSRVNSGAMQLRDLLNQIWGNLVDRAKHENKDPKKKTSNLEMRTAADRALISEILGKDGYQRKKLETHLDFLNTLHSQLSETNFGKNPLSEDISKLISYFEQWIILIDDITGIVCT